jgi:pyruvate/2-oxoglutarate dehydrogenase complex dihydrolipoamide acyltransferase (E2) component
VADFQPARWPSSSGGKKSVHAQQVTSSTQIPDPAIPPDDGPDATDAAKALAAEHSIRLETVTGTGHDGRITKDDVQAIVDKANGEPLELVPDEADQD